jgi:hypothetical protein
MKRDDLDQELGRLRQASEHIAANLIELEIDSGRQLLDASTLTGVSARRWTAASAALTDLWTWRALLDGLLERAEKLRSKWRWHELEALLGGPSIELTSGPVPLVERDLLGSAEMATRCTPEELLARMSTAFDLAKTVVGEFAAAWAALTPRLTAARGSLEQVQGLAGQLGDSDRTYLVEAANHIANFTTTLGSDPLSLHPTQLDRVIESLKTSRRELEAAAELRAALEARLGDARARHTTLTTLVQDARAAHEEALVKIAVPAAPPAPEPPDDLGAELDEIGTLARSGAWRDAQRGLESWNARTSKRLQEAQRVLGANRAPLEARSQLRGLLEAYQVKSGRVGAVEDPELERIHAQAHQALYTAPTDLARAAQLVRRYQEMISVAASARETVR